MIYYILKNKRRHYYEKILCIVLTITFLLTSGIESFANKNDYKLDTLQKIHQYMIQHNYLQLNTDGTINVLYFKNNPNVSFSDSLVSEYISNIQIINQSIENLVELSKEDWNSYETSMNFSYLPLLQNDNLKYDNLLVFAYQQVCDKWKTIQKDMQNLEKDINIYFNKSGNYCL